MSARLAGHEVYTGILPAIDFPVLEGARHEKRRTAAYHAIWIGLRKAGQPALVGRIRGEAAARLTSPFPVVVLAFWLTLARWIVVRLGRTATTHAGHKGESLT